MSNCAHTNPPEIMVKAEEWLASRGIGKESWAGLTVRHAENTPGAHWESVIIDIQWRGSEWIVTRIDRRPEPFEGPAGLSIVS